MKSNHKLNPKGLGFRTFIYFLVFAGVLLLAVWFLQDVFLDSYYESMKTSQVINLASSIAQEYKEGNIEEVRSIAQSSLSGDDIYMQIEESESIIYPYSSEDYYYSTIISKLRDHMTSVAHDGNAENDVYTKTFDSSKSSQYFFTYSAIITNDSDTILYIVAPLYPVSSTVQILRSQFFIILLIALILSVVLAVFLSRKISKPITKIIKSSKRMADGEYGVTFPVRKGNYSEINTLASSLTKASHELKKSAELQKDIIANVSHDLRTPLTMIKSYAEMIRDLTGDKPEKRNEQLNIIIAETDRLTLLVHDMMVLSRIQSGNIEIQKTQFDIVEATKTLLDPFRVLQEKNNIDILFISKTPSIVVDADKEKIMQVLSNLITNAIKYSDPDKLRRTVTVKLRRWGHRMHCEVTDNGLGIPSEDIPHIWDRYYRTSSTNARPQKGSGLGLSIVREILAQHNAKYGVESTLGEGSTFWFELEAIPPAPPVSTTRYANTFKQSSRSNNVRNTRMKNNYDTSDNKYYNYKNR